jgi:hypothetical protein
LVTIFVESTPLLASCLIGCDLALQDGAEPAANSVSAVNLIRLATFLDRIGTDSTNRE